MGCLVVFLLFISLYGVFGPSTIFIFVIFIVVGLVFAMNDENKQKELAKKTKQNRNKTHDKILDKVRPDKVIRDDTVLGNTAIYISNYRRQVMFINLTSDTRVMYYFDELIECSIEEDGVTIESGGVGRAIVGGVLAGGVGAVVGAATRSSKPTTLSLSVRIVTRNLDRPLYTIPIIKEAIKRDSSDYKYRKRLAEQIYATMLSIIKR